MILSQDIEDGKSVVLLTELKLVRCNQELLVIILVPLLLHFYQR